MKNPSSFWPRNLKFGQVVEKNVILHFFAIFPGGNFWKFGPYFMKPIVLELKGA